MWGFGSRAGEEFRGNSKYLYNYIEKKHKDIEIYWIAKSVKENIKLKKQGINSIYAYDLKNIKTEMNRIVKNELDCIDKQRVICNEIIERKNKDCLSYNEQLIQDKESLNKKISLQQKKYKSLKFKTTIALAISGVIVTALTTSLIYGTL